MAPSPLRKLLMDFDPNENEVLVLESGQVAEVRKLLLELEGKNKNLQVQLTEELDRWARMSHDMRGPLGSVASLLGVVASAEKKKIGAKQLDLLKTARNGINNVLDLVNEIVDYSKLRHQKIKVAKQNFNLIDSLTQIYKLFLPRSQDQNLALNLDLDSELAKGYVGDRIKVERIVTNLISNALKFTEKGSVTIKAEVASGSSNTRHKIRITVTDTGVGISDKAIATIFGKFQQEEHTGKVFDGAGLGLTICQEFCEAMGGNISVTSRQGVGSTFTVVIPLRTAGSLLPTVEKIVPDGLQGKSVLVCDDEPSSKQLLSAAFKKAGCKVATASNGREAVTHAREHAVDLIIIDCNMPEMDGWQAAQMIRAEYPHNPPPVIIGVSGTARDDIIARCRAAGMDDCLEKGTPLVQMYQTAVRNITA